MTDRVIKVSLVAQAGQLIAETQKAGRAVRELGTDVEKLGAKKQAFQQIGATALIAGTVIAAGLGLAIGKFAEFDSAMSEVQASTHETAANMGLLREAAIDAGADTVFSATEAAGAIDELSKAGVGTADVLSGGLAGSLALASAGSLDVADAASIAATALTQFKLEGEDIPHVADLLAAGAGKAQGSVQDLGEALKQGGLVASQAGQSLDDTVGVLSAFASAGLLGSDAGTSLKTAILALENPSTKAAAVMKEYGISVYVANGAMLVFAGIAAQLKGGLSVKYEEERNSALATIFGSDAVRAASVLYEQGAEGIQSWNEKVNDTGYAAETARLKLDNLQGDLEKLGGSFDTALIQSGSGANDILRTLVQTATGAVDAFGQLPQPALDAGLAIGTAAGSVTLVGGAAFSALPKLAEMKDSLEALKLSGKAVGLTIGGVALGISAAAAVFAFYTARAADSKQITDSFVATLDQTSGALTRYSRDLVVTTLQQKGIYDEAKKAGVGQKELTDAVLEGGEAYKKVRARLDEYDQGIDGAQRVGMAFSGTLFTLHGDLDDVAGAVENSAAAFDNQKAATDAANETTVDHTASVEALGGAAQDASFDISGLADTIRGFGSTQLDVNSATRDFEAAIDAVTASVQENGTSLDVTDEAGRRNQATLDAIASSTLNLAAATVEQTGKQEDATAVIGQGRQALIDQLAQFGITGAEADAYADKLGLIPGQIDTAVVVNGIPEAETALGTFINKDRTIRVRTVVDASTLTQVGGRTATIGVLPGLSEGGYTGPGPKYQPAGIVHAGEWVSKAETVNVPENLAALKYMHAGGVIRGYADGGYVRGDRTQYMRSGPSASYAGGSRVSRDINIASVTVGNPNELVWDLQRMQLQAQARAGSEDVNA